MKPISSDALLKCNYVCIQNPNEHPNIFMKHSHNHYEFIYFESGNIKHVVENREYKLKHHDLVFVRPLSYHYLALNSNEEYRRINVAFSADLVDAHILAKIPNDLDVIHCPPGSIIAENFEKIKFYQEHLSEEDAQLAITCLLREILLNLAYFNDNTNTQFTSLSPILESALKYINENLFTIQSISEISNSLFITESYFFKLFKEQLKITPKKYINNKRILFAQQLIQRGHKPTEVYTQCGFDSYVGFYKQYVKAFGIPPSKDCTAKYV